MPVRAETIVNGRAKVQFRLPPEVASERAWVAGDFNDWSTNALPMQSQPDGSLVAEIEVESGRSYRFRYYLGDGRWENDWAADAYVDNEHGGSDSVVTVPSARAGGTDGSNTS
jgi:1,4-alpha-glucan branching enzyme